MKKEIQIDSGAVQVRLTDCGIIIIRYADDYSVSLQTAEKITDAIRSLVGKTDMAMLHVPGMHTTSDDGVREYLALMSKKKSKKAEAIVIRNLDQRIKANFYLRINRPECPTVLFDSEEEAAKWLKNCSCTSS